MGYGEQAYDSQVGCIPCTTNTELIIIFFIESFWCVKRILQSDRIGSVYSVQLLYPAAYLRSFCEKIEIELEMNLICVYN